MSKDHGAMNDDLDLGGAAEAMAALLPDDEPGEQPRGPDGKFVKQANGETEEIDPNATETKGEGEETEEAEADPASQEASPGEGDIPAEIEKLGEALGIDQETIEKELTLDIGGEPVSLAEARQRLAAMGEFEGQRAALDKARAEHETQAKAATEALEREHGFAQAMLTDMYQRIVGDANALRQQRADMDLETYLQQKEGLEERAAYWQHMRAKFEHTFAQHQNELTVKTQDQIKGEWDKVQKAAPRLNPAWATSEGLKGAQETLKAYLVNEGVPAEVVDQIYAAPMVILGLKGMLYDELQKAKPKTLSTARVKPRLIRSGTPQGQKARAAEDTQRTIRRVQNTGRIDDAAAAIEKLLG